MSTSETPKGIPACLAAYLPSTHGVCSLDDLSEIFLTTRSRILLEQNSREMQFIDQEKQLRSHYDDAIAETEKKCRILQDDLAQLIHRRESAIRSLHSDRESYKEDVQTRLLMLGLWLRDKREWFVKQQKQSVMQQAEQAQKDEEATE